MGSHGERFSRRGQFLGSLGKTNDECKERIHRGYLLGGFNPQSEIRKGQSAIVSTCGSFPYA